MSAQTLPLNFFVGGTMLMLVVLGLGVAVLMPGPDRWGRRFFIAFFALLVVYVGACLVDMTTYGNPEFLLAEETACYLEFLLSSLLMPMTAAYLLYCCGEDWRKSALSRAVLALWGVSFTVLQIAQFTSSFYSFTPEGEYIHGPCYPLLPAPLIASALLSLAALFHWRKRLSRRYYYAFLTYLLTLAAVSVVDLFVVTNVPSVIGVTISALSMYMLILSDQIARDLRQQREIAHQRASIMVLQMRPHFIYNTMMSIYYLCVQDPHKAQRVTLDFTTYLRKNFTAIASENTIPFSEELEHTRAYLAVEQAQLEDRLFVDYDTPHTRFRVPPLTLQPIVENAVKHGMDPDADPLHISIRTRETESGNEILVEDDGSGFEPIDNHEPHIALANIRQRLEMMCGGSMAILPRSGRGTLVMVTIPFRQGKE